MFIIIIIAMTSDMVLFVVVIAVCFPGPHNTYTIYFTLPFVLFCFILLLFIKTLINFVVLLFKVLLITIKKFLFMLHYVMVPWYCLNITI